MNKQIKARLDALERTYKTKHDGGLFISNGAVSTADAEAMARLEEQGIDFLHIRIVPAAVKTD